MKTNGLSLHVSQTPKRKTLAHCVEMYLPSCLLWVWPTPPRQCCWRDSEAPLDSYSGAGSWWSGWFLHHSAHRPCGPRNRSACRILPAREKIMHCDQTKKTYTGRLKPKKKRQIAWPTTSDISLHTKIMANFTFTELPPLCESLSLPWFWTSQTCSNKSVATWYKYIPNNTMQYIAICTFYSGANCNSWPLYLYYAKKQ